MIDQDGNNLGEMPIHTAMAASKKAGLDLVEVAANRQVPVCRIADWGKMQYRNQKKERMKKRATVEHKEIKLTPATGDHDYKVKLKKVADLLGRGASVCVTVSLRGRLQQRPEAGDEMLERILGDLGETVRVQARTKNARSVGVTVVASRTKS